MPKSTGERIRKGYRGLIPGYLENVAKNLGTKKKPNGADRIALARARRLRKEITQN